MPSLADLTPRKPAQNASSVRTEPLQAPDVSQWAPNAVCEWFPCEKCGEQTLVMKVGVWHQPEHICDACRRAEDIERQAQAEVTKLERRAEIHQKVQQKLAATQKDREKRIDAELSPVVAKVRAEITERLRWEDSQQFMRDAEAEELAKIVSELKGA